MKDLQELKSILLAMDLELAKLRALLAKTWI